MTLTALLTFLPLSLATWQWYRLGEKQEYNQTIITRCQSEALTFSEMLALPLSRLHGRMMSFKGHAGLSVKLFRTKNPKKPLDVIAYEVENVENVENHVIMVVAQHRVQPNIIVEGNLRQATHTWSVLHKKHLWTGVDPIAMGHSLGYENVFPLYVLEKDASRLSALCPIKSHRHLQYILTWLVLAFLFMIMGVFWVRKNH